MHCPSSTATLFANLEALAALLKVGYSQEPDEDEIRVDGGSDEDRTESSEIGTGGIGTGSSDVNAGINSGSVAVGAGASGIKGSTVLRAQCTSNCSVVNVRFEAGKASRGISVGELAPLAVAEVVESLCW